ncbi:hypothetical protein C8R44DRAFT_894142 [Mycena epipterygia]|nr:hypothetical protein C8R44DRAFT_894142 [Mycena epipterygia]
MSFLLLLVRLHHLVMFLYDVRNKLGLVDLIATVVEIGVTLFSTVSHYKWGTVPDGPNLLIFLALILLNIALIVTATFRIASLYQAESITKFEFFGGCDASLAHRGPIGLLYGTRRPLVSGESTYIAALRICALVLICISLPVYAVMVTVIRPLNAPMLTRWVGGSSNNLTAFYAEDVNIRGRNVSIFLIPVLPTDANAFQVGAYELGSNSSTASLNCPVSVQTDSEGCSKADCSLPWSRIKNVTVIVNFTRLSTPLNSRSGVLYVIPGAGNASDILASHIVALVKLIPRTVFKNRWTFLLGSLSKEKEFVICETSVVQSDPFPPTSDLDTATLGIIQRDQSPMMSLEEHAEHSLFSGLGSLGGLWTIMNNTFVLIFGASILYFLFGSAPLPALGLIHTVQHTALLQEWKKDFPAFVTEGSPGSKSAGSLAFLRQRLLPPHFDEELNELPTPDAAEENFDLERVPLAP